jgi:threonine dehydrogenase-like Zn-dependent dehydrogenase
MLSNNAYAEYDVAETNSIVRLPEGLEGQPFPAEPLGCAVNIFRRSCINKGDVVAVVGIGFLGALLTQLASLAEATVIAVARKDFALEMAKQFGATHLVKMEEKWKVAEKVKELTGGVFCDTVIEATGHQEPLDIASELTKERGRLVIAGYHQDGLRQINMQLWNWRGIDVINAHERSHAIYLEGMREAVAAVESGLLTPSPLYTHRFSLAQINKAMQLTAERPDGFMKALILF